MALRAILNVRIESLRSVVYCVDADVQRVIRLKAEPRMASEADTAVANAVQHFRNIRSALMAAVARSGGSDKRGWRRRTHLYIQGGAPIERFPSELAPS